MRRVRQWRLGRRDELLMAGVPRDKARARVRPEIEEILERWRSR